MKNLYHIAFDPENSRFLFKGETPSNETTAPEQEPSGALNTLEDFDKAFDLLEQTAKEDLSKAKSMTKGLIDKMSALYKKTNEDKELPSLVLKKLETVTNQYIENINEATKIYKKMVKKTDRVSDEITKIENKIQEAEDLAALDGETTNEKIAELKKELQEKGAEKNKLYSDAQIVAVKIYNEASATEKTIRSFFATKNVTEKAAPVAEETITDDANEDADLYEEEIVEPELDKVLSKVRAKTKSTKETKSGTKKIGATTPDQIKNVQNNLEGKWKVYRENGESFLNGLTAADLAEYGIGDGKSLPKDLLATDPNSPKEKGGLLYVRKIQENLNVKPYDGIFGRKTEGATSGTANNTPEESGTNTNDANEDVAETSAANKKKVFDAIKGVAKSYSKTITGINKKTGEPYIGSYVFKDGKQTSDSLWYYPNIDKWGVMKKSAEGKKELTMDLTKEAAQALLRENINVNSPLVVKTEETGRFYTDHTTRTKYPVIKIEGSGSFIEKDGAIYPLRSSHGAQRLGEVSSKYTTKEGAVVATAKEHYQRKLDKISDKTDVPVSNLEEIHHWGKDFFVRLKNNDMKGGNPNTKLAAEIGVSDAEDFKKWLRGDGGATFLKGNYADLYEYFNKTIG